MNKLEYNKYQIVTKLREGLKKSDIYHFIGGGVSEGQLSLSIFFVPNVLKIISRH